MKSLNEIKETYGHMQHPNFNGKDDAFTMYPISLPYRSVLTLKRRWTDAKTIQKEVLNVCDPKRLRSSTKFTDNVWVTDVEVVASVNGRAVVCRIHPERSGLYISINDAQYEIVEVDGIDASFYSPLNYILG
jgi:hypothetical protein